MIRILLQKAFNLKLQWIKLVANALQSIRLKILMSLIPEEEPISVYVEDLMISQIRMFKKKISLQMRQSTVKLKRKTDR
jgi:hypothetical protein